MTTLLFIYLILLALSLIIFLGCKIINDFNYLISIEEPEFKEDSKLTSKVKWFLHLFGIKTKVNQLCGYQRMVLELQIKMAENDENKHQLMALCQCQAKDIDTFFN